MNRMKLLLASTALAAASALPAAALTLDNSTRLGVESEPFSGIINDLGNESGALDQIQQGDITDTAATGDNLTDTTDGDGDLAATTGATGGMMMNDADFVIAADNEFVGDSVVSSDGTTLGQVVEVRQAPDGALRLFVQLEPAIDSRAERIVLTVPAGTEVQSDGEIQLAMSESEFTTTIGTQVN